MNQKPLWITIIIMGMCTIIALVINFLTISPISDIAHFTPPSFSAQLDKKSNPTITSIHTLSSSPINIIGQTPPKEFVSITAEPKQQRSGSGAKFTSEKTTIPQTRAAHTGWKTYHNAKYQYSIDYPNAGTVKDFSNDFSKPRLNYINITDTSDNLPHVNITIMVSSSSDFLNSYTARDAHIKRNINGNLVSIYYGKRQDTNPDPGGGHGEVSYIYAYLPKNGLFYEIEFLGFGSDINDPVFSEYIKSFYVN